MPIHSHYMENSTKQIREIFSQYLKTINQFSKEMLTALTYEESSDASLLFGFCLLQNIGCKKSE